MAVQSIAEMQRQFMIVSHRSPNTSYDRITRIRDKCEAAGSNQNVHTCLGRLRSSTNPEGILV